MNEAAAHHAIALGLIGVGAIVFISLFFVAAPYGRYMRKGWGVTVSNRVGWMVMETPAAMGFAIIYALGEHALDPVPLALAALWLTHYVHRAYVWPFKLRAAKKPMPIAITAMAIVFNVLNAYVNARWISQLGHYPASWFFDPRFIAGVALFALGMAVNVRSDNILFGLRKPGQEGYKIPYGGAYRWVSAPNYLGELIEWGAWAIASWSLAGLSFFLFTAANLVPRAVAHHRWYRRTFPDYPAERRAIIPWLV
jgi:protein-S-isoprenylcysteine O-methyltransferase Ste14